MKLSDQFEPGFLGGFCLRDLMDFFRAAGCRVDGRYKPRAAVAVACAALTSLLKPLDDWIVERSGGGKPCDSPLFISGLHRSGTTFLQRLLACDPGMCHPARLDCFHPHSFLALRSLGAARLLALVPSKARHMDNVEGGWLSPEEDVFAMMVLGAFGRRLHAVFPKSHPGFSEVERPEDYRTALGFFVRKLECLHGRRVVLKSQIHMSRIPDILEVFSDAKFLLIFRDPVARSASLKAMHDSPGRDWCALQSAPPVDHGKALAHSAGLLERYFADRHLVPEGNLAEIRYEDLVENVPAVLAGAYEQLGLPGREKAFRAMEKRGPVVTMRTRKTSGDSTEWLGKIVESHREIYERGYYPMPNGATEK